MLVDADVIAELRCDNNLKALPSDARPCVVLCDWLGVSHAQ